MALAGTALAGVDPIAGLDLIGPPGLGPEQWNPAGAKNGRHLVMAVARPEFWRSVAVI